jgi:hypothetical protein
MYVYHPNIFNPNKLYLIDPFRRTQLHTYQKIQRAILNFTLAPRDEICYLGVNTLYCLEEWRGKQRISTPGDNFIPR